MVEGGLGRMAVGEKGREALDCGGTGRYCCGMCAFSDGNSACSSVKSKVVEYLSSSRQKPQTTTKEGGILTRNEVFRGSEAHIFSSVGDKCIFEFSP